jgi:hypothetical protein
MPGLISGYHQYSQFVANAHIDKFGCRQYFLFRDERNVHSRRRDELQFQGRRSKCTEWDVTDIYYQYIDKWTGSRCNSYELEWMYSHVSRHNKYSTRFTDTDTYEFGWR